MNVVTASPREVDQFARRYGRYVEKRSVNDIDYNDIAFCNTLLYRAHLAPLTCFGVSIQIYEGRVSLLDVSTGTRLDQPWFFGVKVQEFGCYPCYPDQKPYEVRLRRNHVGRLWRAFVTLSPESSAKEREAAFAFNLNCLSKIGGCKDSRELNPRVWENAEQQ